ncbi:MAG: ComF family protein [Alphaproteobacteria bacterium]|nr:ComF family protein [Alphaproteobacteria bacterium]
MGPVNILRALAACLVDFALPPRCPACGVITAEHQQFCLSCWGKMDFLGAPCCDSCGLPFAFEQPETSRCGACLAHPPAHDRARAVLAYGDIARTIALKLKYGRRIGLARLIARHMERHVQPEKRAEMLLVPVPLHRWRLGWRGFNQSALIAQALGRSLGLPVELDILQRIKSTPPLRGMNPSQRIKTLSGAFQLARKPRSQLIGKTVVLVDDVYTSGATANSCAKVLKRGGAASVHILCWARVLRDESSALIDNHAAHANLGMKE